MAGGGVPLAQYLQGCVQRSRVESLAAQRSISYQINRQGGTALMTAGYPSSGSWGVM